MLLNPRNAINLQPKDKEIFTNKFANTIIKEILHLIRLYLEFCFTHFLEQTITRLTRIILLNCDPYWSYAYELTWESQSRDLVLSYHDLIYCLRTNWRLSTILKTSNKSVQSNAFWYVKVCILWKCIQYTIHWDKTQILNKFSLDKINGTKNALFFLPRAPTHHSFAFKLQFLHELKHKILLSKTVRGIFHFQFRFVFIKVCIFCSTKYMDFLTLNVIIPFKIKIIEKPRIVLVPDLWILICNKNF